MSCMMRDDMAHMEASLVAMADIDSAFRTALFESFFAAFPRRRDLFYSLDPASRRMTDETIAMLYALAAGERWVPDMVNELVSTHRAYGPLPVEEFGAFITLIIDHIGERAGAAWSPECDAAWRRQGDQLFAMICAAQAGWAHALPGYAAH